MAVLIEHVLHSTFCAPFSDVCAAMNPQELEVMRMLYENGCTPSGEEACCLRLRGSGGDGGSTGAESRSSYLEMYKEKKEEKVRVIYMAIRTACSMYRAVRIMCIYSCLLSQSCRSQ